MSATEDVPKILVVDDEPFMRRTIMAMLRATGRFLVDEADDGDTALAMIPTFRPDIVVCDVRMPNLGGLQVVEQLRNHREPSLRDTPVIMLTVSADEATVRNAVSLNISGYLVKPVSTRQLASHVTAIMQRKEAKAYD